MSITTLQEKPSVRIYTTQFWLVCLSTLFLFCSFTMIIAELPAYLSQLGGAEYKGLIISLFTLTAGLSRPFSGKLADTIGRMPVIILGTLTAFVCSLLYPILTTVAGFLWLRLLHGFTTGFAPTGYTCYVADIIPAERRGEAMGYLGFANNIGAALAPTLGSWLAGEWGMPIMFYASAAMAILSGIVLLFIRESLAEPKPFSWKILYIKKEEIYEPTVLTPSLLMVLSVFSMGTMLALAPDYSTHLGIENRGLFFMFYTLSSLFIRIFAGRASDEYGRFYVVRQGLFVLIIAMLVLTFSYDTYTLFIGAILLGLSLGTIAPAVFAWTIDLAPKQYIGRSLATLYIALEIGIGTGSLISSWIYANQTDRFVYAFALASLLALVAWIYAYVLKRQKSYI